MAENLGTSLLELTTGDAEMKTGLATAQKDVAAFVVDVGESLQGVGLAATKAFGFAIPAKVRVFTNDQLDAAKSWARE